MKKFIPKLIQLKKAFNTEILIPKYQRNYSWDTDKIYDLFLDILDEFKITVGEEKTKQDFDEYSKALSDKRSDLNMFYLGQIVYEENFIVDGQQRLTSLQIIFRAMNDYLAFKEWGELDNIHALFIATEGAKIKSAKIDEKNSKIIQNLRKPIEEIIGSKTQESKDFKRSKFYKNYEKIFSVLKTKELSKKQVDNLKHFILNYIEVMKVEITSTSDAIIFFEVMNSKSMPLTPADLIKNNILKISKDSDGDAERWNFIADELKHKNADLSKYIRYLYVAKQGQVSKVKLFDEIKKTKDFDVLNLMKKYLESYKAIIGISTENNQIVESLVYTIKTLGASESLSPILLEILNRSIKEQEDAVKLLENLATFAYKFFFKQGFKANNYSSKVTEIAKKIANIKEKMNIAMLSDLWAKYDEELTTWDRKDKDENKFTLKDITFNSEQAKSAIKLSKALMPLLYAYIDSKNIIDDKEVAKNRDSINYDTLDIEHIYPKTKTSEWVKLSDPDDIWKLGNLVPLSQSKNRAAKNSSFKIKHNLYIGEDDLKNKKSLFYITLVSKFNDSFKITDKTIWNSDKIDKRNKLIVEKVNELGLFVK